MSKATTLCKHQHQTAKDLRNELEELRKTSEMEAYAIPEQAGPAPRRRNRARRLAMTAIVGALVIAAIVLGIREFARSSGSGPIDSVAVLPLQNLSGDPEDRYFAAGITEALISKLGQIGVPVISRTSVMQLQGSTLTLPEIARTLNVDAIVEGSVLRVTDRVVVTARLVESANDRQLWSRDYDYELRDVLNLRNEVAREIAHSIRAELTSAERRLVAAREPVDPVAFDLYLKGREVLARDFSTVTAEEAVDYFRQATDLAPDFALAHAALAEAYSRRTDRSFPEELLDAGRSAALLAIKQDDSLGVPYAALGRIKFNYEWDWIGADHDLREALDREPNNTSVLEVCATFLLLAGRFDEGLELTRHRVRLDPLNLSTRQHLALGYLWAGRWEQALAEYDRLIALLEQLPNSTVERAAHFQLAMVYLFTGRYEQARAEAAQADLTSERIWISVLEGDRQAGYDELARLEALEPEQVDPFNLAILCALLGEKDKAFAALDRALEERLPMLLLLNVHPGLDPLRADPRFDAVYRAVGFPPLQNPLRLLEAELVSSDQD